MLNVTLHTSITEKKIMCKKLYRDTLIGGLCQTYKPQATCHDRFDRKTIFWRMLNVKKII